MDLLYRVKVYTVTGIYNGALMRACLRARVVPIGETAERVCRMESKRSAYNGSGIQKTKLLDYKFSHTGETYTT